MSQYHSSEAESFRKILIAVAKGKHGAKDMTRQQAAEALTFLFSREAHAAQIGAFLTAMRFKGSQWQELAGFLDAMEAHATLVDSGLKGVLNCNGPYDGRKKALNLALPAALVCATAGVAVMLHSGSDLPPKDGVTTGRILEELGVAANKAPSSVARDMQRKGFGHLSASAYLHGVELLKPYRQVLFYRSFLHACELLLNPAKAEYSLIGAAHDSFLERFARTQGERGIARVMAVRGLDGSDELPMKAVAAVRWVAGELTQFTLTPTDYGLPEQPHQPCPGVEESAKRIEALLNGEEPALLHALIYNAGVRLQLSQRCASIGEGIELARELVGSGKVAAKLDALRTS